MPYTLRKLAKQNKWRVFNRKTGRVRAYGTTYEKAKRQIRLLNYLEHK